MHRLWCTRQPEHAECGNMPPRSLRRRTLALAEWTASPQSCSAAKCAATASPAPRWSLARAWGSSRNMLRTCSSGRSSRQLVASWGWAGLHTIHTGSATERSRIHEACLGAAGEEAGQREVQGQTVSRNVAACTRRRPKRARRRRRHTLPLAIVAGADELLHGNRRGHLGGSLGVSSVCLTHSSGRCLCAHRLLQIYESQLHALELLQGQPHRRIVPQHRRKALAASLQLCRYGAHAGGMHPVPQGQAAALRALSSGSSGSGSERSSSACLEALLQAPTPTMQLHCTTTLHSLHRRVHT